jgi:hypothetical protein
MNQEPPAGAEALKGFLHLPKEDKKKLGTVPSKAATFSSEHISYQPLAILKVLSGLTFRMIDPILSSIFSIIQRRQEALASRPFSAHRGLAVVVVSSEDFRLLNTLSLMMSPPESQPPLPYKDHPLWRLRRITLWVGFIGLFLQLFAIPAQGWDEGGLSFVALFLVISIIYIFYDLTTWATEKAALDQQSAPSENDDEPREPKWPRLFLLVSDALLAFALQFIFWVAVGIISNGYGYGGHGGVLLQSYASLPAFFASILHTIAFWKELMARKKAQWLRTLPPKPCTQCGFVSINTNPQEHGHCSSRHDPTEDRLPQWARAFNNQSRGRQTDIETGLVESSSDGGEESLLITPETSDESTLKGYGTLSQSVPSLNNDCDGIIKKKKSKRVIGEDWLGKSRHGNSKSKGKGKAVYQSSEVDEMGA